MKYINYNSQRGIVNYIADYVLSIINGIGDYDSIIEVTNVGKFIIVNGLTSLPEVLQFQPINDHLTERFNQPFNIIDTISYGIELESPNEMWFTFYNNQERPSYHPKVVEYLKTESDFNSIEYNETLSVEVDYNSGPSKTKFTTIPLNISSEFPHGYSLNTGRLQYYYSEYVSLNIFNMTKSKKINFKISNVINENEDLDIKIVSDSCYPSKDVESLVLDVFDFDFDSFRHVLSSYNIIDDITDPLGPKPWLFKDKIDDVIIW